MGLSIQCVFVKSVCVHEFICGVLLGVSASEGLYEEKVEIKRIGQE